MPCGNGTGPRWQGQRNLRATGCSTDTNTQCRCGGGHGKRNDHGPQEQPLNPREELGYLEEVARGLEDDLKAVKEKIEALRLNQ